MVRLPVARTRVAAILDLKSSTKVSSESLG